MVSCGVIKGEGVPVTLQTLCSWWSFTFCDFLDQESANHAPKPNPACLLFLWIKIYWNTVMLTHLQNDFFFSEAVQLCMALHDICDSEMLSCPVEWDLGHQRFKNSEQNICIFSPKIYNDRDFCKYNIHLLLYGFFCFLTINPWTIQGWGTDPPRRGKSTWKL